MVSDYTPEQLKRFSTKFYELGGGDPKELLKGSIEELGRFNYGYFQMFSKIISFYKIDKLFRRIIKIHGLEMDLLNAVHWTDKRIEGHICLCYIAYTLLTYLQNKLEKSGFKLSENAIRKAISSMQVSHIKNKKTNFYLRSANKENVDGLIKK